ncbi:hypothetical protein EWI61_05295 [Methylolobus aquaticus]|nr:hypothetical protein EWI61_05295 [Methylolobus aquaticus]
MATGFTRGLKAALFFIHGGAFDVGASSQAVFMGARLAAKRQAMVVVMNYRPTAGPP